MRESYEDDAKVCSCCNRKHNCGNGNELNDLCCDCSPSECHECPYAEDVGNTIELCGCCSNCRAECAMDI